MVVEDDGDIRDSVAEILEEEGYTVSVAADGLEALRHLECDSPKPDLILLDLMMPNMNGFQFREEQLKGEHAAIPIAVVTADGDAKDKARQLHAAGYVRKPLKVQPLLDLVGKVLGGG
jgi:DNA-binding response OmpR family regulator